MKQIPLNPEDDGTSRTVKAQYYKCGLANFFRRGGYGATAVAVLDCGEDMEKKATGGERLAKMIVGGANHKALPLD